MKLETGLRANSGFTLVELVVVLTILAVLAATATVSTAGLVEQSRYDATRTTLTDVESAVLGRPGQLDSQNHPWIQGFVADVGRLPMVIGTPGLGEVTDATLLSELWLRLPDPNDPNDPLDPSIIKAFSIQHASGDDDVQLPCGWRGPYLRLPLGSAQLRDGWGKPVLLLTPDGTPANTAESVGGVATLGANGQEDVPANNVGYDADFGVVLTSSTEPRHEGEVPFQVTGTVPVTADPSPVFVVARLYGATNGKLVTYDQPCLLADEDGDGEEDDPHSLLPGESIDFSGAFEHIPIGPRALRVYLTTTAPTTQDTPTSLDLETPIVSPDCPDCETCKKGAEVGSDGCEKCVAESPIQYLTVVAGGIPTVVVNFPSPD